jgi:hypothetical protein
MRDALYLTKFANFGETMPRPRWGSKPVSGGPRAAKSSLRACMPPPHTHTPPQEIRMLAAYLHDLWLGNLVRSSLRRDVAFSPSFLQKRCLYLVYPNWTSREPVLAAGKEDMLE